MRYYWLGLYNEITSGSYVQLQTTPLTQNTPSPCTEEAITRNRLRDQNVIYYATDVKQNKYSYAWNAFEESWSYSSRVDCSIMLNWPYWYNPIWNIKQQYTRLILSTTEIFLPLTVEMPAASFSISKTKSTPRILIDNKAFMATVAQKGRNAYLCFQMILTLVCYNFTNKIKKMSYLNKHMHIEWVNDTCLKIMHSKVWH